MSIGSFGMLLSQSIYSFKGEGESMLGGDAHMSGLGCVEIPGSISSNTAGSIAFLRSAGIGITYSGLRLETTGEGKKNVMHYYCLPCIKGATTLPKRLAFGFRLQKNMDFNSNFIANPDSVNGMVYREEFSKKGQLTLGNIEIAKRIGDKVGIGFSLNVLFGGAEEIWITNFSDTLFRDTKDSLRSSYLGSSYAFGIVFDFEPLRLNCGYNLPIVCKRVTKSLSYIHPDTTLSEDEVEFPMLFVLGSDFSIGNDFNLLFTLRYRNWSGFTINGQVEDDFIDVLSYGVGFEYKRSRGYKGRSIPLRLGYFHKPWYFKDISEGSIVDDGITLGTAIPVLRKNGYLDVAFIAGRRKTSTIEENFYSVHFGFNFYERW